MRIWRKSDEHNEISDNNSEAYNYDNNNYDNDSDAYNYDNNNNYD